MGVTRCQLERRQHRDHLGHAGNRSQRFLAKLFLVADDPDDGAIGSAAQMGLQSEGLDTLQHVVDLVVGDVTLEDQDHGVAFLTSWWICVARKTGASRAMYQPTGTIVEANGIARSPKTSRSARPAGW